MAFVGAFLLSAQKFGEIERDESDQRVAVVGGSPSRRHDGQKVPSSQARKRRPKMAENPNILKQSSQSIFKIFDAYPNFPVYF